MLGDGEGTPWQVGRWTEAPTDPQAHWGLTGRTPRHFHLNWLERVCSLWTRLPACQWDTNPTGVTPALLVTPLPLAVPTCTRVTSSTLKVANVTYQPCVPQRPGG